MEKSEFLSSLKNFSPTIFNEFYLSNIIEIFEKKRILTKYRVKEEMNVRPIINYYLVFKSYYLNKNIRTFNKYYLFFHI